MLKIYSDAAVSQKNKCAGAGIVIVGEDLYEQLSIPLPVILDNHLAELHAFHLAVKWSVEHDRTDEWTTFFTDSQLVAQAVNNQFIKKEEYLPLYNQIIQLLKRLAYYEVKWIPEKNNKGADNLAKQAIAKQLKKKR
ncbi:ribonuclease HI family protein [Alkalibacterium olivapovliticus]|uniref:Ribonuclease HI n=1 Tax=Alkalibacterium olivapovliticus TaxID=99907 RepID=A0A2T0WBV3_9LACT|nr:ribonuclease HI family protein [Alkalibacterium olivapovliticus]PRY84178.1 ribonuclease HI [Alkalibacterium olivapovliticus]